MRGFALGYVLHSEVQDEQELTRSALFAAPVLLPKQESNA